MAWGGTGRHRGRPQERVVARFRPGNRGAQPKADAGAVQVVSDERAPSLAETSEESGASNGAALTPDEVGEQRGRNRLGDLLVARGSLTGDDLATALLEQTSTGRRLGEVL